MTLSTKYRRLIRLSVIVICAEFSLVFVSVGIYKHFIPSPPGLANIDGNHYGHDFVVHYAAARMALDGGVDAAYDLHAIRKVATTIVDRDLANANVPWVYPPTYLLIILPFALLPYVISYVAWCIANIIAGAAAGWTVLRQWWTPLLIIFCPAAGLNIIAGQNGGITAALMLSGLGLLNRSPTWAGVLFGLMSFKPQFGILIPVALAAGRQWVAFVSAAASVVIFAAISYFVFGAGPWKMLVSQAQSDWLVQAEMLWLKSVTLYPMARSFGLSSAAASGLQIVSALIATVIVIYSWRWKTTPELRAAALSFGTLLATPRAMVYELAILLVPLFFVLARAVRLASLTDWVFGSLLWLCPLAGFFVFEHIGIQIWPALIWAGLLFCVVRYRYPSPSDGVDGPASTRHNGSLSLCVSSPQLGPRRR
jgi:hypothetical protein